MRECLDEAMLQSYFDGELSSQSMERTTLHLASCIPCAAAARELEQETLLLDQAFAAEFEAAVPTERLRRKVDAAVAGLHVVRPVTQRSGLAAFFSSLGSLFTLSPQRTLGYASLVAVLAFAAIFGAISLRKTSQSTPTIAGVDLPSAPSTVAIKNKSDNPLAQVSPTVAPVKYSPVKRQGTPRSAKPKVDPVQLFPGERSYLQTIARLDTTIKAQTAMRPSLQVEYERNLAVVDRAIAATRSAAKSNPNDPDAADFMFAAYQSKVDLLNTIADSRLGGRSH